MGISTKGMKVLGRGAFTKAYLMDNGKVFLKSQCPAKEVMGLGWFPECSLFPVVESTNEIGEYIMDYLPRVTAPSKQLNAHSHALYKELRKLYVQPGYQNWYGVLSDLSDEFEEERDYLLEALDALANYGNDICFEISPRNISCDSAGNLILADVFFFHSALKRVRTGQ